MLSQSGHNKQTMGFAIAYLFDTDNTEDEYKKYSKLHIISVAEDINCSDNLLDLLVSTNPIYSRNQIDYIENYQKFSKWLATNKGKKFIAVIPAYITHGSSFMNMPNIYICDKNFYFEKSQRDDNCISFITDFELIEVDKDSSNKKLLNIAKSIIMAKISQPFLELDYPGRSVI